MCKMNDISVYYLIDKGSMPEANFVCLVGLKVVVVLHEIAKLANIRVLRHCESVTQTFVLYAGRVKCYLIRRLD